VLFKPYCCCAIIHPAIDALKEILAEHGIATEDIKSIEVGYPKGSHNHAAITDPKDILGMQFSTAYSLGLTVLKGKNTPKEYSMEALADPALKAVAAKVSLTNEVGLDKLFEGHMPARVTLTTNDGAVHDELVIDAKGSPAKRLTSDEIDEKFRSMASELFGDERTDQIIHRLRDVVSIDDMASVAQMLVH
jgi:2-methylcitrate dehydratase PrpD